MSENNNEKSKVKAVKQAVTEKRKAVKESITEKKKAVAAKLKKGRENNLAPVKLKLLITVVGRNKSEYYADLIQSFDVNLQVIAHANGTADANTLQILGLTDTDKGVILSVVQEPKLPDILHTLEDRFNTMKGGKGIAFTVPFSSVIGTLIYGFLSNNRTVVKEEKK